MIKIKKDWDEVQAGLQPAVMVLSEIGRRAFFMDGLKGLGEPACSASSQIKKERVMSGLVKNGDHWEGMGDDNNGLFQCNLIAFLKNHHLLPKDLAEMLSLSSSYVSMICNGQKIPPPLRLWTIARIFNTGVENIWVFNDAMMPELLELAKLQSQESKIQARKKVIVGELNQKILTWKNGRTHIASRQTGNNAYN